MRYLPADIDDFVRASAVDTRRIPRLMVIRRSGSCGHEPLETRSPVLDGLHGRRPAIPEAAGHDEPADAKRRERELIEDAGHGSLSADEQGPKRLSAAIEAYLDAKRMRCSPRTIELEQERLVFVKRHFGDVPLSAITATAIAEFQRTRHDAGIANRTINMDVGVLSRVLKSCGRWRALADHVHNLPERQHPVGRALTAEERQATLRSAASNPEWEHVYCAAIVAANTSMRPVEVKHLRRCDVDLVKKLLHVRRSKNETSHRVIPLNASAIEAARADVRARRSARAHGAGALPLAGLPVGPLRPDEADAEVGHGLARAARRRGPATACASTISGTR